ncbi:MAG: SufE family protein [Methyloligellaceae bacterium]
MTIDDILSDFEYLDDWEDRYRYVIELGRGLAPLDEGDRNGETKVQGCVSQVWLKSQIELSTGAGPCLSFRGDSDAMIVKGLIAILIAMYSGRPAREIIESEPQEIFAKMSLQDHLTAQRSNGLASMVARIRRDAEMALSPDPA